MQKDAQSTPAAAGPSEILFRANLGSVTFSHHGHQRRPGGTCTECHHPVNGSGIKACRHCHAKKMQTAETDPPPFFDVKMTLCRGCHLAQREKDHLSRAPLNCKDCHNVKEIR